VIDRYARDEEAIAAGPLAIFYPDFALSVNSA
jgi:hypothetical protein